MVGQCHPKYRRVAALNEENVNVAEKPKFKLIEVATQEKVIR